MRETIRGLAVVGLLVCFQWSSPAAGQSSDPSILIRDLGDPIRGEAAAREVLSLGAKVLPKLAEALTSPAYPEAVKKGVLGVLHDFGPRGRRLLMDSLADPSLELEAATQLAAGPPDASIEKRFLPLLTASRNPAVRLLVLNWLAEHARGTTLDPILFSVLDDSSVDLSHRASALIVERVGVSAIPRLMDKLRELGFVRTTQNRPHRLAVLRTLGLLGRTGADAANRVVSTLIQSLGVDDEREVAVQALVSIGGPAVPGLLMILKAGDTTRAGAAMEALLSVGEQAAPEVVELLSARHPKMRRLASQFLAFYQDQRVFPLLRGLYGKARPAEKVNILQIVSLYPTSDALELLAQASADPDAGVRAEAIDLLAQHQAQAVVPLLLARVEEDAELENRIRALKALRRLGDPTAAASLARLLFHDRWEIRVEILELLARMGTAEHVEAVSQQLSHRRTEVATGAQRVLANITYMSGERTAQNWVAAVAGVLATQKGQKEAEVSSRTVRAADRSIEVLVAGDADPTILVLMSNQYVSAALFPRALALLAQRYRVVVVPFPGCVAAGGVKPGIRSCAVAVAEDLRLVKEEVTKGAVTLVLHSVSGYAGLAFALRYPRLVDRIIWANPVYPGPESIRQVLELSKHHLPARWKAEYEALTSQPGQYLPSARSSYLSRIELASQVKGEGLAMTASPGYWGVSALVEQADFGPDPALNGLVAGLERPMLLVFGQDDWLLETQRKDFLAVGRVRRNLIATTVPGSIRHTMVERPEAFVGAVRHFMERYRFQVAPSGLDGGISTAQVFTGDRESQVARRSSQVAQPTDLPAAGTVAQEPSSLTRFLSAEVPSAAVVVAPVVAETTVEPTPIVAETPVEPTPIVAETTVEPTPIVAETPVEPTPIVAETTVEPTPIVAETPVEPTPIVAETTIEAIPAVKEEAPRRYTELETPPGAQVVDLTRPLPTGTPAGSSSARSLGLEATGERTRSWNWLGWTLVGSGVALAGGGGFMTWLAMDKAGAANDLDPFHPDYSSRFDDTFASARNWAIGSYVAYGLGAAAFLVGLDILLGWPIPVGEKRSSRSALTWFPMALPGGSAVMFDVAF